MAGGQRLAAYLPETAAARIEGVPLAGHLILWGALAFFAAAVAWAAWATLDEVTRAEGRVVPSSQVQILQNLEGGIVSEILVDEGDRVAKGDVLLRIDDTRFASSYRGELRRTAALRARVARLEAEVERVPFTLPAGLEGHALEVYRDELALHQSRLAELENSLAILREQARQRQGELQELRAEQAKLRSGLALAQRELDLTRPLVDQGAMSEMDLIRAQRDVVDLRGGLEVVTLAIPRAESAAEEAAQRIREREVAFVTEARTDLNEAKNELSGLEETNVAMEDRVRRTAVRSPVNGTVKQVKVSTVGQVVQPGIDMMEIVPGDDTLLVEARVRPADIAFLRPGQRATVKLTAYDFAIYGGLDATLERISADSIVDEQGERFFEIQVRTGRDYLGPESAPLPIIPGMTATVDILTGEKTVLEYLLKPINRARELALRER